MKVCPYCRESIQDDAIKCRYCTSSLLPSQIATDPAAKTVTAEPGQVVYVVDSGLIAFGKFVGASLALFATVGVFLYGFDLKRTGEEVNKTVHQVEDLENKTVGIERDVEKAKTDVDAGEKQLQTMLADAEATLASIADKDKQATVLFADIKVRLGSSPSAAESSGSTSGTSVALFPHELSRLYNFPSDLDGRGQTIGLIELGGGFSESDLKTYFSKAKRPMPQITWVSVDGAKNVPTGNSNGADDEVMANIEVAGDTAPAAHIVVYFAPNTDTGFIDAVRKATADTQNRPSILSMAWGSPESTWSRQASSAMNMALAEASHNNITVLAAAGDGGSTDGITDGKMHVAFPASSPWVLACGGTHIVGTMDAIQSETVWNDGDTGGATGGGVSVLFERPEWQSGVDVPARPTGGSGRGIPDVVADASPNSGFKALIGHSFSVLGGTGMSTSFWSGLIALLNQGVGHNVGYINPVLYTRVASSDGLRAITDGNNGNGNIKGYSAGPHWSAVAGLGRPDGLGLIKAFRRAQGQAEMK